MDPLVISGMFRSGTTLLWRILSSDEAFKDYLCEPLHSDLPAQVEKYGHYRFYKGVPMALQLWSSAFHSKRIRLKKGDEYPELKAYLSLLIKNDTIIKFVRLCLRHGWFLENFPQVSLLNIIRDPRAVCHSFLKHNGPAIDRPEVTWNGWYGEEYYNLYCNIPEWAQYLRGLDKEPPYIKILALWRVNAEQGIKDLEDSGLRNWLLVRHEDLVLEPLNTIKKIYSLLKKSASQAVIYNAEGRESFELGGQNKWQDKITAEDLSSWASVPMDIWQRGIETAGLGKIMEKLGYQSSA